MARMGSFLANIHVQLGTVDREAQLERVQQAIAAQAAQEGFEPAPDGALADRTIVVALPRNSDWAVVYDENSDSLDLAALEGLGRALSGDRAAVSSLVHDSDDLVVTLFRNGRRADRITFQPSGRPAKPKWKAWQPILGDRSADFAAAFDKTAGFAEDPLETLATLAGWDPDCALLTYSHRDELPDVPTTELRFSLRPERRFYTLRTGEPDLYAPAATAHVDLVAGMRIDGLGCGATFINDGGPGTGITIVVTETAELREHLAIESVRIANGLGSDLAMSPVESAADEDNRYLRARFRGMPFAPYADWGKLEGWQSMKVSDVISRATLRSCYKGRRSSPASSRSKWSRCHTTLRTKPRPRRR